MTSPTRRSSIKSEPSDRKIRQRDETNWTKRLGKFSLSNFYIEYSQFSLRVYPFPLVGIPDSYRRNSRRFPQAHPSLNKSLKNKSSGISCPAVLTLYILLIIFKLTRTALADRGDRCADLHIRLSRTACQLQPAKPSSLICLLPVSYISTDSRTADFCKLLLWVKRTNPSRLSATILEDIARSAIERLTSDVYRC